MAQVLFVCVCESIAIYVYSMSFFNVSINNRGYKIYVECSIKFS